MVVSVAFKNGPKTYDYLTSLALKPGDFVVVPTGPLGRGDFRFANLDYISVARVIKVKRDSPKATAWVMGKVDIDYYRGMLARITYEKKKELEEMLS